MLTALTWQTFQTAWLHVIWLGTWRLGISMLTWRRAWERALLAETGTWAMQISMLTWRCGAWWLLLATCRGAAWAPLDCCCGSC
jgi:hypothetical protein